jgi:hypothetical protein
MTPVELRRICDSLNPGGQTRLAELLEWNPSTVRRKLSGASRIRRSEALAIRQVACNSNSKPLLNRRPEK